MRRWIDALRAEDELHEVKAEVDWNTELGTIVRMAQGPGTGPALLFSNIKDYNKPGSRGRRVFAGSMSNYRRMAMVFGLHPDTHPRELVKIGRNIMTERSPKISKPGR
jgi:4-hydroxy-3-polyprenylbenzoate decarboxylase